MQALYVTSVEPYSGKTAVCLVLGLELQERGKSVGYLKPLSTQPWRTPAGEIGDEDASFVKDVLRLEEPVAALSPVVVTPEALRDRLSLRNGDDPMRAVRQAASSLGEGKDVLIVEGGGSLREGYAMGLSNPKVAQELGAPVLVLVKYRGEMHVVDDALTADFRLGEQLMGVILNHVPEQASDFVDEVVVPFLNREGIDVLGRLPDMPRLSAMSVRELIDALDARVLTESGDLDALAETFTVGAMNADAALSRFRRQRKKAVITGGDRSDIQLAALETSTVVLVLTGNLHPMPMILEQAESLGVPILLVEADTMETVETIERAYGKTRLGHAEKLETFRRLVADSVHLDSVFEALGA